MQKVLNEWTEWLHTKPASGICALNLSHYETKGPLGRGGDGKELREIDISNGPLIQFYLSKESFRLDIHAEGVERMD
jgi:hypothetical protein